MSNYTSKSNIFWRKRRIIGNYSLIYLILIVFLIISIFPLALIWMTGLKSHVEMFRDPVGLPKELHWENLIKAWTVGKFSVYMKNSALISLPTVVLVILFSSLAGFAFAKLEFYQREFIFLFLLIGFMIPGFAIVIPLYYDLRVMRLLDTHWSVILPLVGFGVSFGSFMMRAFFKNLPDELLDAARIDGCSDLAAFVYIFAPLAKPAITALIVFEFMWSWNIFLFPLLFITSDSLRPIQLGLMYTQTRYTMDYGLVAGQVTLATLPIMAVYVMFQKTFIKGITAGAMKG